MAFLKVNQRLEQGERWCDGHLVRYLSGYRYNGGIVVDSEWYEGFEVDPPTIPAGFELINIGIGLYMNAQPPIATAFLKPKEVANG